MTDCIFLADLLSADVKKQVGFLIGTKMNIQSIRYFFWEIGKTVSMQGRCAKTP